MYDTIRNTIHTMLSRFKIYQDRQHTCSFQPFNSFHLFSTDVTLWSLRVQDNVAGGREDEEVQLSLTVSWVFSSDFLREKS